MQISISNCNNINSGSIKIEPNKLNIKYGINGTGKSTIANAIKLHIEKNGDLSSLKPFNSNGDNPSISLPKDILKIKIYNDEYVSRYLFINNGENLHQNSFDVFIKPDDYNKKNKEINENLNIVKNFVNESEIFTKLSSQRNDLAKQIKLNKLQTNYNDTGVGKAFNEGNKIANTTETKLFEKYLNSSDNKVAWYDWHILGRSYKIENSCPFCARDLQDGFDDITSKLDNLFNKKNVDALVKTSKIIDAMSSYFNPKVKPFFNQVFNSENKLPDEDNKKIVKFIKELNMICDKINYINNLNFFSLKDFDDKEEFINNLKIDISSLEFLNNETIIIVLTELNSKIEELAKNIKTIIKDINILNSSIKKKTSNNLKRINDFLDTVGMNYEVGLKDNNLILHSKKMTETIDPNKHLSWGERNCFALALFLFDCISEDNDLIILDDPVSSFDFNKKYAITHYLFNEKDSLNGKTVLMLTHDLEPIINMVKVKGFDLINTTYIENNNSIVEEHDITKHDINSIIDVSKKCFGNKNLNTINRLIHLRRYLELSNDYELEYNMISSLFKGKSIPTFKNLITKKERDLLPKEIYSTEIEIRKYIDNFDYNDLLKVIKDINQLVKIYYNSTPNYEKMEIFRIICTAHKILNDSDDVLAKFINEAYHIENCYIFQLDPYAYNLVPNYIIQKCTEIIKTRIPIGIPVSS